MTDTSQGTTDPRVVMLVVMVLGAIALGGLAGIVWLLATNHSSAVVAPVVALVGPAIGAISALLVSTRSAPAAAPPAAPPPAP